MGRVSERGQLAGQEKAMTESAWKDKVSNAKPIQATIWGSRGSTPVSGPEHTQYGGHTSCVQVEAGKHTILFDAGSGLWDYMKTLRVEVKANDGRLPRPVHLMLSHLHDDHVQGLKLFLAEFGPLATREHPITIHAPPLVFLNEHSNRDPVTGAPWDKDSGSVPPKAYFQRFMHAPSFPVSLATHLNNPHIRFKTIDSERGPMLDWLWDKERLQVHNTLLAHGQEKALGFKVTHNNQTLCYVPDYGRVMDQKADPAPHDTKPDRRLVDFVKDADVLIIDSMFADEQFRDSPNLRRFGHTTLEHVMHIAQAAGVKELVFFHHSPLANDQALNQRQKYAKQYAKDHRLNGFNYRHAEDQMRIRIDEKQVTITPSDAGRQEIEAQRLAIPERGAGASRG